MRDFHPAGLAVEVSLVASGEDHMVVSGLQLHPTPGCLAAIVSLSREQSTRGGSGLKPALELFEPLEIIAGRGEIVLAQKLPRGPDFGFVNRRSDVDPALQGLDEAPGESFMVFGRHDLPQP